MWRFVRHLPIRPINFADETDVARHDRMVALVEAMLDLHRKLATAVTDQEKTVLQRQIVATDRTRRRRTGWWNEAVRADGGGGWDRGRFGSRREVGEAPAAEARSTGAGNCERSGYWPRSTVRNAARRYSRTPRCSRNWTMFGSSWKSPSSVTR